MTPNAYNLADLLYAAAPWSKFMEFNLIALIDPATREKHHISLMGANGNHHALALYLGPDALRAFNTSQEVAMPQEDRMRLILETPQLQCAFDAREEMMKSELAAIKAAGKTYRGDKWPSFRRFQPGHAPAPATPPEIELLCHAIEQTLEVSKTYEFGDDTISSPNGIRSVLTRRFDDTSWLTEQTPIDVSLHDFPRPMPSELLIEKILRHPKIKPVEIAFQLIPSAIGSSREKAIYPYVLLVIEPYSKCVIGFEMLSVENVTIDNLPAAAVNALLKMLDENKIFPSAFHVASPITANMLHNSAQALCIHLQVKEYLPALDETLHSLLQSMME